MNILVLAMGGSGTRLGAKIPKQYIEINGFPIFGYILEKYNCLDFIDKIVIVSHENWIDYVKNIVKKLHADKVIDVVKGGDTRNGSIINALNKIKEFGATDEDNILFHDATHPYVDEEGTKQVIDAIEVFGAATLASYNYDTVYEKTEDDMIEKVLPRSKIIAGASPEGFKFGLIYNIYQKATKENLEQMTSAGAIALANGINMKVIKCSTINLKLTYYNDLEILKKIINSLFFEEFEAEKYNKGL